MDGRGTWYGKFDLQKGEEKVKNPHLTRKP